jgi:hypothetical protein
VDGLAAHLANLIEQPELWHTLVQNALAHVRSYDWGQIAAQYYQEVYQPLIMEQIS